VTRQLTLYGRPECHLCQDMQNDLHILLQDQEVEVNVIDVDSDPGLVEQYGSRVPVLVAGQQELCHYFLDQQAVIQYFELE
jgi:glutaredoxin